MSEELQFIRDRLMRLETFIGIADAASGLRKELEEVKVEVHSFKLVLRGIEKRMYMAIGAVSVVGFFIEHVVTH